MYETNTASTRIWDSLGFKRIGRVPACGNLRSSTELVDAIIYGRDLSSEGDGLVSEERFDKIRYYLKHAKYPTGADRAEKSRLRSAATHYKLIVGDDGTPERLMLKDKEVISDPQAQYEIAREIHLQSHAGINKTTAVIATKYHWVRIKETVSQVIKNCPECKEAGKAPVVHAEHSTNHIEKSKEKIHQQPTQQPRSLLTDSRFSPQHSRVLGDHTFLPKRNSFSTQGQQSMHSALAHLEDYSTISIDPQIMEQLTSQLDPPFQHPRDAYTQAGLSNFGAPSHMHHHAHQDDYNSAENDHFIAEAAAVALDHDQSMDLVEASHMASDAQMSQHLLQEAYNHGEGNPHFQQ